MSLAKDRMHRRIEKVLVTLESLLVAMFVGVCVGLYFGYCSPPEYGWKIGATSGIVFFVGIFIWKRFLIWKERS